MSADLEGTGRTPEPETFEDVEVAASEVHPEARRRQFLRNLQWWALSGLLVFVILLGFLGPTLYPGDALNQSLVDRLRPPLSTGSDGTFYLLGSDAVGRDTLARVISGIRVSIIVATVSVLLGGVLGSILGVVSGYAGGWLDSVIMRLVDVQMSIPFLIFAMILSAILGPGLFNTIIALGVTSWVVYARVVRSEVLSLRTRDYVDSAKALGASRRRIIFVHIFPNVINNLTVVATLEIGRMILVEASLSYIGLGVQPPTPSLGGMVSDGQDYVFTQWWISAIPGAVIMLVVLAFVLFGDVLRDRLDPKRD